MFEKLDFMMRFWHLRARFGDPRGGLSASERIELMSLMRLMATDHALPDPGPPPRTEEGFLVQMTSQHGFVAGELRLVCAGGVVVACHTPMPVGQSTLVRVADEDSGTEYTLPCLVEWGFVGNPSAMALRVDGVPAQRRVALQESGVWPTPMGWSETRAASIK